MQALSWESSQSLAICLHVLDEQVWTVANDLAGLPQSVGGSQSSAQAASLHNVKEPTMPLPPPQDFSSPVFLQRQCAWRVVDLKTRPTAYHSTLTLPLNPQAGLGPAGASLYFGYTIINTLTLRTGWKVLWQGALPFNRLHKGAMVRSSAR